MQTEIFGLIDIHYLRYLAAVRGGAHTAVLKVRAEICLRCGERLYSKETIRRFEEIRAKLKRQETAEFKPMGLSFEVV